MRPARPPLAIVDIGSNSARVVVYDREAGGHLRIIASARASLRLVEGVVENHAIGEEAIRRTREALRDFRAIAQGAGARSLRVYATAAVREARDSARFSRMVHGATGERLRLLSADDEARYGFHGALRGLPSRHGVLFDLGGGSVQITEFRNRERRRSWSLPLGALRLSRRYLEHDPATDKELKGLRAHVDGFLEELPLRRVRDAARLVGTGGTVRNLAKIDRFKTPSPVPRLHGHELARKTIEELQSELRESPEKRRGQVLGLSRDRVDSIVAGAVVIERLLSRVKADHIVVSGQGLREGLAYAALGEMDAPPLCVRATSITALLSRFRGVDPAHAERRAEVATYLFAKLVRDEGERGRLFLRALGDAARVLDVGRAVDFFDRHEHAARIVLASELDGYSQVEVARIAAVLHAADEEGILFDDFEPLIRHSDRSIIEQAGVSLLLADEILDRVRRGAMPRITIVVSASRVRIRVAQIGSWRPRGLAERFARTFDRDLVVSV